MNETPTIAAVLLLLLMLSKAAAANEANESAASRFGPACGARNMVVLRSGAVFTDETEDFGCLTVDEPVVSTTPVSTDVGTPRFFDAGNNCTLEFPLNSSNISVNGIPLLQFNLCGSPIGDAGRTGNQSEAYRTELAFPLWAAIIVAVLSLTISVVTVVGNVIVLISFVIERTLRQATNYFIASLAVSDLLIGLFSMNFYSLYIILNDEWVLGKVVCNLWLSLDYTVCLASQYTVFFITVDRFCSVKMPAKYRNWRTDNKVLAMVLFSWIIPSLIFFVSILGWDHFTNAPPPDPLVKVTCVAGFQNDPLFNFLLTVFYYWITLFVMCGLYVGIYRVALNMARKSKAKQRRINSHLGGNLTEALPQANNASHPDGHANSKADNKPTVTDHLNSSNTANTLTGHSDDKRPSVSGRYQSQLLPDQTTETSGYFDRAEDSVPPQKPRTQSVQSAILSTTVALLHSAQVADCQTTTTMTLHPIIEPIDPHGNQVENGATSDRDADAAPCKCTKVQSGPGYYQSIENDAERLDSGAYCDDLASPASTTFVLRRLSIQNNHRINFALVPSAGPAVQSRLGGRRLHDISQMLPHLKDVNILVAADENEEDTVRSPVWKRRCSFEDGEVQKKARMGNHGLQGEPDRSCLEPLVTERNEVDADDADDFAGIKLTLMHTPTAEVSGKSFDEHNLIVPAYSNPARNQSWDSRNSRESRESDAACRPQRSDSQFVDMSTKTGVSLLHALVLSLLDFFNKVIRGCVALCKRDKQTKRKSKSENRARKAVRTITFILGAFVTCWTPYHIMVFISSFWPETAHSEMFNHFFRMSYWLCYLNSPINPFCYAYVNAQFKKTFLRILKCDLHVT